jgi:hypothetical protein
VELLSVIEMVTLYLGAVVVVPELVVVVTPLTVCEAVVVAVVPPLTAVVAVVIGVTTVIDWRNPRLLAGAYMAKVCEPDPRLLGNTPRSVTRPVESAFSVSST